MKLRIAITALATIFALGAVAAPKLSPKAQGTEVAFVSSIQSDLNARFSTPAAAEAAGYFRYTNEDNTGSISYANNAWTSVDAKHPSQLWFDAAGHLIGADFSVPYSATAPTLWGVDPKRWEEFGAHVHYVYTNAGVPVYGHAVGEKKFVAAGGDLNHPDAATLVKMGVLKDASTVTHVFLFPHIWDLEVWVKDNPNGAFAEMNPLVKPSKSAEGGSM